MSRTLTITRTALTPPLADLVITGSPFGGAKFWLPEEGLEEPDAEWVYTHMPDNPDVHGKEKIGARLEQTTLPVMIYTQAASAVALKANKAELKAALAQWSFEVTLDLNGDGGDTWTADLCAPRWGEVDSGMLAVHMARASVVIPIYPVPVGA